MAQTLFKKKSSDAWAPTHSQVPYLCKNKREHTPGAPPKSTPGLSSGPNKALCKANSISSVFVDGIQEVRMYINGKIGGINKA